MALGTLGSTLNDELNRLANGGTYRDMNQMVDEALAAKQWANRENINPYSTDTVGILNEIAGLGLDKKNWLDFNGVCNYIAGTTGLPAAAALRQVYPTTDLLTGVASYYIDAATPTNWGSLGYVRLNGVAGNFLSVPDASNLDITGDIDIRARLAPATWTPSVETAIIGKYSYSDNNRSYGFGWHAAADFSKLVFRTSTAGTTANLQVSATANVPFAANQEGWVRATYAANVAGNYEVKFFTSTDGTNWTQLGSTITGAAVGATFNSNAPVLIGAVGNLTTNAGALTANVFRAQILNGIGGTTVLDVNIATDFKASNEDTFTATTGQTVTVNGVDTIANLGAAGSLLPTTLGSSTAADSNDPKFLDFTGINYVYTTGVSGNYLSVPDAAALDITGDIDLRAFIAPDSWTPSATQRIITKFNGTDGNLSYILGLTNSGGLQLSLSSNGTLASTITTTSAVLTATAGTPLWVRVTWRQSDGRVQFFTSTDGTTWTQLGTNLTNASTSIFASISNVEIGSSANGTGNLFSGKIFRAQILNGIDGTKVLDVDTSTLQTGADTYIVPTTYSGAAGAYFTGTGLSLNGVAGNYVSTPDASQLDITGDIDLQAEVALTNWSSGGTQNIIAKRSSIGDQRSYRMAVSGTGGIFLEWSTNGIAATVVSSTDITNFSAGTRRWIRATRVASTGLTRFFTSTDGSTWTQLGADVSAASGNIFNSTTPLEIGTMNGGLTDPANGTFYRAVVKSGIDGFPVFDATFVGVPANSLRMIESSTYKAVVTLNTTRYCTINRSTSGRKTVAVTQPTWLFGTDDYMEVNNRYMSSGTYLYLPGVLGNDATSPDSAAVSVTGDIDMRVKVAMDDWTPSASSAFLTKWASGTGLSYYFYVSTTGFLRVAWTANNSTTIDKSSTVATGFADGTTKWVRATIDVDNGAGGNDVAFYTSDDGTSWTQLGATVTTTGTTSIFDGTTPLRIGSAPTGDVSRGKFFRAQVRNGINGTVAFDANFETSITSLNQASFTESSANAATVTINRSGSAYRSAGITTAGYLYPGATNTFAASATDFLNFGASQSFTVFFAARQWATPASFGNYINKKDNSTNSGSGYRFGSYSTLLQTFGQVADGTTNNPDRFAATYAAGTLINTYGIADRAAQTFVVTQNSNSSATASLAGFGAISSYFQFSIGRSSQGTGYQDFELIGAAVFRQALTAAQIRQISNYFANREVYL